MGLFSKKTGGAPPDILNAALGVVSAGSIYWVLSNGEEHYTPELAVTLPSLAAGTAIGTPYAQLLTLFEGEDRDVLDASVRDLRRNGESMMISIASKDGRIFDVRGQRLYKNMADGKGAYADMITLQDRTEVYQHLGQVEQERLEAVAVSESLQVMLNAVPFPMWLRHPDLRLAVTNRAYQVAVGNEDGAEIASSLCGPDGKGLARDVKSKGQIAHKQGNLVMAGKRKFVEVVERPFPKNPQAPYQYLSVGYVRDLTQVAEAQRMVKAVTSGNEKVLNLMPNAIAVFGPDKRLNFYNHAYAEFWNLERSFLNRTPAASEVFDKLRQMRAFPEYSNFKEFKGSIDRLFTSLMETQEELLHLPDERSLRQIIAPHPQGGLLFIYEDVSEHMRLTTDYNTLLEVYQNSLDELQEAVGVFSPDGRLKLSNPSYRKLCLLPVDINDMKEEYHLSEILDLNKGVDAYDGTWEAYKAERMKILMARTPHSGVLDQADGSILEYAILPLPDGNIMHRYVDVTTQKKVERALLERNEALETADQMKSEFLANISYGLRTPMNALIGFTQMLNQKVAGELNEKQEEYARYILAASEELRILTDDIIDLAAIEADFMKLNIKSFEMSDLLEDIRNLFQPKAAAKKIFLTIEGEEVGQVEADEDRLRQCLYNLLRHALATTPVEGKISLTVDQRNAELIFVIEDNGEGMSKAEQGNLFTQYTPSHTQSAKAGAGLGMPLVKALVDKHGGAIDVDSDVGRGTRIRFTIPLGETKAN